MEAIGDAIAEIMLVGGTSAIGTIDGERVGILASGENFPDALAASPHGGINQAPIILVEPPSVLGSATEGWLNAACPDVGVVRALGGTSPTRSSTRTRLTRSSTEGHLDLP